MTRSQSTTAEEAPGGVVVVVGGVDPGGGAGLLRDVATAMALGARAHAVGTAWTEQDARVHRVEPRAPAAVGEALARAVAAGPAAVKIGMAVGPATAAAILEALAGFAGPVVMDPVLATSRGGMLWDGQPRELLPLARRATVVTPNAGEAAALAGRAVSGEADAQAAALELRERDGLAGVLVKGGHLPAPGAGAEVVDLLVTASGTARFGHPRAPGPSPRGTGCALATAIAVELGRGRGLEDAVAAATAWIARAIAGARDAGGERHL